MADRIVVEFDGDAKGLVSTANAATKSISDFDKKAQASLNNVDNAFKGAGNAAQKSGAQLKASNTNYMNFGHVIQDLPFGLIGIQNNLTQLIPSVGLLGLGFSVLVSALTFLQVGTSNWTRGLTGNKKAIDASKLSGDEYAATLEAVRSATLKGNQEAQNDIVTLKALYGVYTNANLPLQERKQAYKELQDLYPDYFKNIKFEQDASLKTTTAYGLLTNAILASARARVAADKIAGNSGKILEFEQKNITLQKERVLLEGKVASNRKNAKSFLDLDLASQRKLLDIYKEQKSNKDEQNKLDAENLNLVKNIQKNLQTPGSTLTDGVGNLNEVEKTGKKLKSLSDIMKELKIDLEQTEAKFDTTFDEKRAKNIDDYQKAIDNLIANGYNKASDAVQKLIDKQEELLNNLKKRGGKLGRVDNGGASVLDVSSDKEIFAVVKNVKVTKDAVVDFSGALKIPPIVPTDWSKQIKGATDNFERDFIGILSNINNQADKSFLNVVNNLGDALSYQFNDIFLGQLKEQIKNLVAGAKVDFAQLASAASGILGGIISGATNKTSGVGQGIGGALSGAATGFMLGGTVGAIAGGLVGLFSGIFGAKKARKQEELQAKQLAEAEKQTKLLERQNALAYTSSIIGRMTNQGTITGFDVNSTGQLIARIQGKELQLMLDKVNADKKRGV